MSKMRDAIGVLLAGGHWGDEGIALRIRCVVRMSRVNVE